MTRVLIVVGVIAVAILAILRPWTVRPISSASASAFDPAAYVASIWDTRVRQATTDAMAIGSVASRDLTAGRSLFVQGVGTVSSADSHSRVGLVHVRFSEGVEADVQVGPVIRGTAIRDALPFIQFSDFANQIDYAEVASLLNERVLEQLRRLPKPATLVGRRMRVVGALRVAGSSWEITPISLEMAGGRE